MPMSFSRRNFFNVAAGAGAAIGTLEAQAPAQQQAPRQRRKPVEPWVDESQPYPYEQSRSTVSLVRGDSRRQNAHDALVAIDDQILPVLKTKKYVIVKPNCVSNRPMGTTNPEAVMGILDYLAPRYKGPVVIAESSYNTAAKFEELGFNKIQEEHSDRKITLVDLNEEAKYEVLSIFDYHMRVIPVRLAARLLDPDAYIICSSVMKTHNAALVTLSLKNMVLGAPLASSSKETARWSDKRKYHVGIRVMQGNMMLTAQKMRPFWGAAVIDGFEGMEGNGPHAGTPVDHRIAIASTDYLAADRVGVEAMGVDPNWVGHCVYSYRAGLGQYDLAKIDVRGEKVADVRRPYLLHSDSEQQKEWMKPMEDLPPQLG